MRDWGVGSQGEEGYIMSAWLLIKLEEPHPAKAVLCLPSPLAGRGWGWGSFFIGNLADMILFEGIWTFELERWAFLLERWTFELERWAFLLERWTFELERWAFLLERWAFLLERWAFLLERWAFLLGRWAFLLERWTFLLERWAF